MRAEPRHSSTNESGEHCSRLNLGRNKYVDSLGDEEEYEHMDEKISAYR